MAEYNNKVQLQNGIVLIDLTQDTVEKDKLFAGITAHDKTGAPVTGEFTIDDELAAQDSLIDQIEQALIGKAGGGGITPSGTLEITENGEYDVTNYASANVNVPTPEPVIQPLTVTENGTYTPPDGVDGYSPVVVNVAGSGGGGEVNTGSCTVAITVPSSSNYYVGRETASSDGTIGYAITRNYTSGKITVSTRCDSLMYIMASTIKGASCDSGEILKIVSGYGIAFKTPAVSGATVNITLTA